MVAILFYQFFFLVIDWYFLIPVVIEETFDLVAELVISIVIPSKEAKAEIEIGPVVVEAKIIKLFGLVLFYFFKEIIFNLNSWLMCFSFIWYFTYY